MIHGSSLIVGHKSASVPQGEVNPLIPERVDLGEEAPEPSIRVVQNWFARIP